MTSSSGEHVPVIEVEGELGAVVEGILDGQASLIKESEMKNIE